MDENIDFIIRKLNKKTFIQKWIKGLYKKKPIIIYGGPGTGKTMLANHILKNHTIININLDFYKTNIDLKSYLNDHFYKKSIIMMFQKNKNIYKAILFDDIDFILSYDKKIFNSIIEFSKKEIKNHPIIYVTNNNLKKNKHILNIYENSYPININLKLNDYKYIIRNYLLNNINKDDIDLDILIQKSNYNFNTIKVNLDYSKNVNNIQTKDIHLSINNDETFDKNIYQLPLNDIYRIYSSDYIIKSLNLLENLPLLIFKKNKLSYQNKIVLLNKIYHSCCLGDNHLTFIYNLNNWDLLQYIVTNLIVYPVYLLKENKINLDCNYKYNHYLSKSIIHTYHFKLLNQNNINYHILSLIYECVRTKNYSLLNDLISYHKLNKKVINKFCKYFNITKNDLKNNEIILL